MERAPIDDTLDRIDREYQAGCLAWVKRKRPKEWRKMVKLEGEITRLAFQNNKMKLVKVLNEYETFVLEMVRIFKIPEKQTGSLFDGTVT